MTEIAIFGAGRVGTALARTMLRADHNVSLVGAGPPEDTQLIADIVAPGARVTRARDAASSSQIMILAIPLHKYQSLQPEIFAGHVVIDAMNYWPPVNGNLAQFERSPSSVVIADHLAGARLVKTLNHIGYHEVESDGLPSSDPERRALGIAADDHAAAQEVANFIDSLGYDAVIVGPLSRSDTLQPETPIFDGRLTANQIRDELGLDVTNPLSFTR